jgi:hypothetical protein|tara:strand:- start:251 stop:457 length:207 start_codon:yes stop_codon:yes gene_type:complete
MKNANRKIRNGYYVYNGYEIELVDGTWLMKPVGETEWTDAEDSLKWAKEMIDVYNRNQAELNIARGTK